jgi:hypothetical protein
VKLHGLRSGRLMVRQLQSLKKPPRKPARRDVDGEVAGTTRRNRIGTGEGLGRDRSVAAHGLRPGGDVPLAIGRELTDRGTCPKSPHPLAESGLHRETCH